MLLKVSSITKPAARFSFDSSFDKFIYEPLKLNSNVFDARQKRKVFLNCVIVSIKSFQLTECRYGSDNCENGLVKQVKEFTLNCALFWSAMSVFDT